MVFCLCKLVALKQKAVIDKFWISDLSKNLVWFRPSTRAQFISLHVICSALIRRLKVILKVLRHLNRPIRRMAILCFLRWFNFFVFRLLMQFWLDDRRLSSLCMLMGLLHLALHRVLEFQVGIFTVAIWKASTMSDYIYCPLPDFALILFIQKSLWLPIQFKWLLKTIVLDLVQLSNELRTAPTTWYRSHFWQTFNLA